MSPPARNEALTAETRIKPDISVVWRRVEDAIILVHLGTNQTYELNGTAGRLWELLDGGCTYGEALAQLGQEFEVGEEELQSEARDLVALLLEERLAEQTPPSG